jgi:hypothetical protein
VTIYGTPGGTPLNQAGGFQGTQPGNPVQATLSLVNPGVGLFPPNSNNNSGDTILASVARGACPANVLTTGLGVTGSGSKPVLTALNSAGTRGTGAAFVANGGSANNGPNGANGVPLAAGGMGQSNGATGETTVLPANAPSSLPVIPALPQYRG